MEAARAAMHTRTRLPDMEQVQDLGDPGVLSAQDHVTIMARRAIGTMAIHGHMEESSVIIAWYVELKTYWDFIIDSLYS
jgi:hypothetical protein